MTILVKCDKCKEIIKFNYLKNGDNYKCKKCGFEGIVTDKNIQKELESKNDKGEPIYSSDKSLKDDKYKAIMEIKKCSKCGYENSGNAKFCSECGESLGITHGESDNPKVVNTVDGKSIEEETFPSFILKKTFDKYTSHELFDMIKDIGASYTDFMNKYGASEKHKASAEDLKSVWFDSFVLGRGIWVRIEGTSIENWVAFWQSVLRQKGAKVFKDAWNKWIKNLYNYCEENMIWVNTMTYEERQKQIQKEIEEKSHVTGGQLYVGQDIEEDKK
ncbi:MAG: zinc ribbon domain-containing protein [bacterium]|nr:zinc ribbon domain-containing protein [bacterium]